ncbi:matrix protein [Wenzhou Rhinolophus pusillus ledantevirus 1]|uniref:matrix protein n=1 Tax=Wenzhou Rhinolophus pusillus ledantevirus 1 TaxID=2929007 RepID=UPI002481BDE0|nr:matrix protein [Wenzhou Rhinolophus pusillus ledantevirus 1]UOX72916.1 matrix protein [Wenzhou Rhinolophus pusillus ledantevirus 1]
MLSVFKKDKKAKKAMEVERRTAEESFFTLPSAPLSPEKKIKSCVLRVQSWIEIRSVEPIKSVQECVKVLEPWIDEAICPIRQYVLDSWMFFCMGVHARRDPVCTVEFVYKAQIDQVLEFKHDVGELDPSNCKPINVRFLTAHAGRRCEVSFYSKMSQSKRKGAPFFILYYAPLKDGNPPGDMMKWNINLPFKIINDEEEGPYLCSA